MSDGGDAMGMRRQQFECVCEVEFVTPKRYLDHGMAGTLQAERQPFQPPADVDDLPENRGVLNDVAPEAAYRDKRVELLRLCRSR